MLKIDDTQDEDKENIDPCRKKKDKTRTYTKSYKQGNESLISKSNVLTEVPCLKQSGIRKIASTVDSCSDLFSSDDESTKTNQHANTKEYVEINNNLESLDEKQEG